MNTDKHRFSPIFLPCPSVFICGYCLHLRCDQKVEQVNCWRRYTQLAHHPDDLATMQRTVIDDMLHLRHQGERERLAFEIAIAQCASQRVFAQLVEQGAARKLKLMPAGAQRRQLSEICPVPAVRGRGAVPTFEPNPFRAGHVHERTVQRAMTYFEIIVALLIGQLLCRVEREMIGPFGISEKLANVMEIHHCP